MPPLRHEHDGHQRVSVITAQQRREIWTTEMAIEAKWLDILKATGPQTFAIALACAIFLFLPKWDIISSLEPWETHLVVFALLVCGLLSTASTVLRIQKFFPADRWLLFAINNWRLKRQVEKYIPFMNEKER